MSPPVLALRAAQASPPLLGVTVSGTAFAPGQPVMVHIRLNNTLGTRFYFVAGGRLDDCRPEVDWLGPNGTGRPVPVTKTEAGIREMGASGTGGDVAILPLAVGGSREFGPYDFSRLFDMRRPGVYAIRVRKDLSFLGRGGWEPHVSEPVRIVVR